MRREHPSASAELLRSEAIRNGVVNEEALSLSTLRRLYRSADLPRVPRKKANRPTDVQRRRWQAANPGDLWHGDVCHLVLTDEQGHPRKVLVHGLLDDASRDCVALAPRFQEREQDMLEILCGALLRHAPPSTLYLDNGACYRGDVLQLVCKRLGINLVHAQPYSPEARGKMERFWRSLRQRCTDHLSPRSSVHQVGQALWAWLDADYHVRPHAGLLGMTPRRRYLADLERRAAPLTPKHLASALEVELTRQVKKDCTFDLDGKTYEVGGRHLGGKRITVIVDAMTDRPLRVMSQGQPVRFGLCDPVSNRRRAQAPDMEEPNVEPKASAPFDPISALLEKAREAKDE
jgi:transposase InsO family protein